MPLKYTNFRFNADDTGTGTYCLPLRLQLRFVRTHTLWDGIYIIIFPIGTLFLPISFVPRIFCPRYVLSRCVCPSTQKFVGFEIEFIHKLWKWQQREKAHRLIPKLGIRNLSPHLRNSAILRTNKTIAELRTKKKLRTLKIWLPQFRNFSQSPASPLLSCLLSSGWF